MNSRSIVIFRWVESDGDVEKNAFPNISGISNTCYLVNIRFFLHLDSRDVAADHGTVLWLWLDEKCRNDSM